MLKYITFGMKRSGLFHAFHGTDFGQDHRQQPALVKKIQSARRLRTLE